MVGHDRDETGSSFAAPKVARIAAQLQRLLPDQPALLYRALIVQSARWPTWAETLLAELRHPDVRRNFERREQSVSIEMGSCLVSSAERNGIGL